MEIADRQHGQFFYYVVRHVIYLAISFIISSIVVQVPTQAWQKIAVPLLLVTLLCLLFVLIPGIGKSVNGSRRWIPLGIVRFQVSELAKFSIIIYLARYLVRYSKNISTQISGFIKPLFLVGVIALLLLKEPDLGAAIIILFTTIGMLFLAGPRLLPFLCLLGFSGLALLGLIMGSSYRMARLMTFFDPWKHAFGHGYQLTQALIACGRGGLLGNGLGESIQKLFYLPEAHTDFIFAVLVEELGLIGGLILLTLFTILVMRALYIGWQCMTYQLFFNAYLAYGIGINFALSVMINVGVNIGLLPTKGLTLPLISYGGNSLIMTCVMLAVLLRIDYELRRIRLV
jgi:cell division protein FtsW